MKVTQKELKAEIGKHFICDSRRMDLISMLIISIIVFCTVSYSELSKILNPTVRAASNFKRVQRFFRYFNFGFTPYVNFVWSMLERDGNVKGRYVLALDRTNWKYGERNINILMLAVAYKGGAIPLVWKLLDKRGNSNREERLSLIRSLKRRLSPERWASIRCLTMDREFDGSKWLSELDDMKLAFVLRIKKSVLIENGGKSRRAHRLFSGETRRVLRKTRLVFGMKLYVGGQRLKDKKGKEEYLILASNIKGSSAAVLYGERWGIELLFGQLKSRGFNFGDTHVTHLERIKTMIFILSMAYVWAVLTGEWLVKNGLKIPLKRINGKLRKQHSLFRVGLDTLRASLITNAQMTHLIRLLSCT